MESNLRYLSTEDRASSRRRSSLQARRPLVTGTEVGGLLGNDASGASCVITTDSEGRRLARQNSQVQSIELRT